MLQAHNRMTMTLPLAFLLFFGGLVLSLMSSVVLAERLDQAGHRLNFPPGLIGLVTALGADSPEIASAVTAMISGQHDLGRGVIFGSNIFNIAALLGVTALVARRVAVSRPNLVLNGGVALALTLAIATQTMGWLGPLPTGLLLLAIALPYAVLSSLRRSTVRSPNFPDFARGWVERAVLEEARDINTEEITLQRFTLADGLAIVPLLTAIVVSSVAMVNAAEFLGQRYHVSQLVVGSFVVATLTGLPNLIAALRLAVAGRGTALSSEAFNSNSLNLLVGAYLPTLFVSLAPPSGEAVLALVALVAMTVAAVTLGLVGRGFGRVSALLLILGYAAFTLAALW